MINIDRTIRVERPPVEVFEFLVDGRNDIQWRYDVVESTLEEGDPFAAGARYRQVMVAGRHEFEGTYEITAIDAPTSFEWQTTDESRYQWSGLCEVEPADDGAGTDVTLHMAMTTRGLRRLLEPLRRTNLRRAADRYLLDLKFVLEEGELEEGEELDEDLAQDEAEEDANRP
jgi:hypothetical protein